MDSSQQGLYLLTVVSSLISLFSVFIMIVICGMVKLWKHSSVRLILYVNLSNTLSGLVLILPTYRYQFMCSFQGHLINFAIISQIIWAGIFLHYAYFKIVQEQKFSRIIEVRYLGLALVPSLITSLPPFVSENLGNNCWESTNSPLKDAVSSFGFLIISLLTFLISLSFILGILVHLDLFPKGYMTDDYNKKLKKFKFMTKFSIFYFLSFTIIFIYSVLEQINRERRPIDFMAMLCHTSSGFFITFILLTSEKVKNSIKSYLKPQTPHYDFMREDIERLSSATEELSRDLSD